MTLTITIDGAARLADLPAVRQRLLGLVAAARESSRSARRAAESDRAGVPPASTGARNGGAS